MMRERWIAFITKHLNPHTLESARREKSRFSIIKHVGRKSGKPFEAVVMLAEIPEGFAGELTYGPQVQWYQNIMAAGHCEVVHNGTTYEIDSISPLPTAEGLKAYGFPRSVVLRLLRRTHFMVLHVAAVDTAPCGGCGGVWMLLLRHPYAVFCIHTFPVPVGGGNCATWAAKPVRGRGTFSARVAASPPGSRKVPRWTTDATTPGPHNAKGRASEDARPLANRKGYTE